MKSTKQAMLFSASMILALSPVSLSLAATHAKHTTISTTLSIARAKQIATNLFHIPSYYAMTQENYNSASQGNPPSYNLMFTFTTPTQQQNSINVTLNAQTGEVLNYNRYNGPESFVFPVPESLSAATQAAQAWVKKLSPTHAAQLTLEPLAPQTGTSLTQGVQYTFDFVRMANGVPAPFDGCTVVIDQNGNLVNYSSSWLNLPFPSGKPALSLTQANARYAAGLPLTLSYQQNWQGQSTPSTVLAYSLNPGSYPEFWNAGYLTQSSGIGIPVIDAQTGQVIDATGKVHPIPTQAPLKPLDPHGGRAAFLWKKVNWTEQQALQFAKSALGVPTNFSLTTSSQGQSFPQGDNMWNFTWTNPKNANDQISAQIDSTYGVLQSAYGGSTSYNGKDQYTSAQLFARAKAFLARVFPNDLGSIALKPMTFKKYPGTTTDYQIQLIVNGLPDSGSSGSLTMSGVTGQVANYYSPLQSSNSGPFKSPKGAISLQAAQQAWVKAAPLSLMYLETQPSGYAQGTTTGHVILAYAPVGSLVYGGMVDAFTGQVLNGPQTPGYRGIPSDIVGLPQTPELELLVNDGLLSVDANGHAQPNALMTRAAFVKLVVGAFNLSQGGTPMMAGLSHGIQASLSDVSSASPAFSAIVSAYEMGLLPPGPLFQPNALATRGFAATLLARALGYNALLAHPTLFHFTASDAASIPTDHLAADAIATTLGMFQLQNGSFMDSTPISIKDAAVAVVYGANALAKNGPSPIRFQG